MTPLTLGKRKSKRPRKPQRRNRKQQSAVELENSLIRAAQAGSRDAQAEIITRHLNFIWKAAKSVKSRAETVEDLVQVGCIAMLKCIEDFEPERGYRFSTYSYRIVQQKMFGHGYQAGLIRLPGKYGIDHSRSGKSAAKAEAALFTLPMLESGHMDPLDHAPIPLDAMIQDEQLKLMRRALKQLDWQHREIVTRRAAGERLRDIGDDFGLTRERIRQLESEALNLLRMVMAGKSIAHCYAA